VQNEVWFSWDDLAGITGGSWSPAPGAGGPGGVTAVEDDSRKATEGALFIAIKGEFSDGHDYLLKALAAGAGALCVQRAPDAELAAALAERGAPCLCVTDTLAAFQQLARAHRLKFPDLRVVGVTGSNGKTSTKEMIAAVLERKWPGQVLKTEGNTNNHFGVPRNLLRLSQRHRAAVLEIGSNHPGEIKTLAAVAQPDLGVVCNIGRAHLEFFIDLAGVAQEKGALLAGLPPDGTAVYPIDAAHMDTLAAKAGARAHLTFGANPQADVAVEYLGPRGGEFRIRLTWRESGASRTFAWGWGGEHQALNAGAAAAVGALVGLAPDRIVEGLRNCELPGMRMEVREHESVHWANDAYNANADSMRASLAWFRELTADAPPGARLVVLGDMLELGPNAESEHRDVLAWARDTLPDAEIVAVGQTMAAAGERCGLRTFPSAAEARPYLLEHVAPGQWVLLKASRGVGLEAVLPWRDE